MENEILKKGNIKLEKTFKTSNFLKEMQKVSGTKKVALGSSDEFKIHDWYSTGSNMLDMQLNGGKIFQGGIPSSKLTIFAGAESCGKTYFAIQTIKDFLEKNPEDGIVGFYDSEDNVSKETFLNSGIPLEHLDRIMISQVETFEQFRTQVIQAYQYAKENKIKFMVVLDSYGGLLSQKELDEASAKPDKEGIAVVKATVGRPQITGKQLCKIVSHRAPEVNAPVIFISHVYANIGSLFGGTTISGGSGIRYQNSNCVKFTRAKSKESNESMHDNDGIIVTSTLEKSRFAREITKVKSMIHFNYGVLRYFGFISLLDEAGLIEKTGNRFMIEKTPEGEWTGKKYWAKEINDNPSLIKPHLKKLEEWTIAQFGLGKVSLTEGSGNEIFKKSLNLNTDDFDDSIELSSNPDEIDVVEIVTEKNVVYSKDAEEIGKLQDDFKKSIAEAKKKVTEVV